MYELYALSDRGVLAPELALALLSVIGGVIVIVMIIPITLKLAGSVRIPSNIRIRLALITAHHRDIAAFAPLPQ